MAGSPPPREDSTHWPPRRRGEDTGHQPPPTGGRAAGGRAFPWWAALACGWRRWIAAGCLYHRDRAAREAPGGESWIAAAASARALRPRRAHQPRWAPRPYDPAAPAAAPELWVVETFELSGHRRRLVTTAGGRDLAAALTTCPGTAAWRPTTADKLSLLLAAGRRALGSRRRRRAQTTRRPVGAPRPLGRRRRRGWGLKSEKGAESQARGLGLRGTHNRATPRSPGLPRALGVPEAADDAALAGPRRASSPCPAASSSSARSPG